MNGFDFQKVLGMDSSINPTKVFFPELDDVSANKLNYYSKSDERIKELANEIESDGLREPCVAYLDENGTYILLSGETRYRSCMELVRHGRLYSFHGRDITGKLPLVLDQRPRNIHYERLAITGSNNKRNALSDIEKADMIRNTIDDLNALADKKEFDWSGKKTWEVVAAKTGLSGHYVRDYLSGKMTRDRKMVDKTEKDDTNFTFGPNVKKEYQGILKAFRNADRNIRLADKLIDDLDMVTRTELLVAVKALYEDLVRFTKTSTDQNSFSYIAHFLNADPEIHRFVSAGDSEAVAELLKARNGTYVTGDDGRYSINNNKIILEKENGEIIPVSITRFTKMLMDYARGV